MLKERGHGLVLIIDDNVTNLKIAAEYLKGQGYEVLIARDGESGISRVKLGMPDLILLDVQMGGIDGFETCRRIKRDPEIKDIPIIFMTALSSVEDKLKGFAAGGVDYVPKPFQVEELLARVNTHLTIYRLQKELQEEIRERQLAEASLRKANIELERLAVLDGLTQIANRRRFDQYLQSQWLGQSKQYTICLLMCDVDYFKRYNDGYGHQAGDRCLQLVAQAISRSLTRSEDLAARYGGEEFAVILPETEVDGALHIAETIQKELRALKLPHAHSEVNEHVTLSIGVAGMIPLPEEEPKILIAAADQALYQAKHQGRNRFVLYR